jgi:hypothetical protein
VVFNNRLIWILCVSHKNKLYVNEPEATLELKIISSSVVKGSTGKIVKLLVI